MKKIFILAAVAGLAALRLSPWFWRTATAHQRADLIAGVLIAAAVLAVTWHVLTAGGRKRKRKQAQQQRSTYTY